MSKSTLYAFIARGFDVEIANRLASSGHTLNSLKNLDEPGLRNLNIPEELIKTILREPRPPIPLETLNKVLYESRMTCCVCREKNQGIIVHHIQEFSDSRSHAEDNLLVLCLNHHGEAHTKRELQLNLTPQRLREFKKRWLEDVKHYDSRAVLSTDLRYSYEDITEISDAVHHSMSFYARSNIPKFSLKAKELSDGHVSQILTEETSNRTIWELIQFPGDGYPSRSIAINDQLIISNFGDSCLLFYKFKDGEFIKLNLDSYEAGKRTLLCERKKFGKSPVLRKYPPGDLLVVDNKLFVGQVFSEFVVVIDLTSREVIKRIPVGGEGNFVYCPKNKLIYFASNKSGKMFIIDPVSYEFEIIPYPEFPLHIGTIFCHPESGLIYLGLHRTSMRELNGDDGEGFDKANSFIAIYDPLEKKYVSQIELEIDDEDRLERCWTSSMLYNAHKKLLYIGMLGSPKNIYLLDTESHNVVGFIKIAPNLKNKNDYVDSLSLAFYQDYLLSVNRSNCELAILSQSPLQHLVSVPLGGTGNGPRHICIHNDQAYISHSEYAGVIVVNLPAVLDLLPL